eukprot:1934215-Lingulodinium_polyedra.AAC.1
MAAGHVMYDYSKRDASRAEKVHETGITFQKTANANKDEYVTARGAMHECLKNQFDEQTYTAPKPKQRQKAKPI